MKYLKLFETTAEYETYINGSDVILPNVSLCNDINGVHYNPYVAPVETLEGAKILCKYNVTYPNSQILLYHQNSGSGSGSGSGDTPMFITMEVDGEKVTPTLYYTFTTTGEHTVLFTLPEGVTSIGENAFKDCSALTSVTIGNSVTEIGAGAFYQCSELTSITIPNSVTTIGDCAFRFCYRLTNITIPNSVTSIGGYAFGDCSALTSVTIGNSVTEIGVGAFYQCYGLTSVTCNASTAPTIKYNTFYNVKTGGTLTVPSGSTRYDVWMSTDNFYLGMYNWTKVEA